MQYIIYKQEDGRIGILFPSDEYMKNHSIKELVKKDLNNTSNYIVKDSIDDIDLGYSDAYTLSDNVISIDFNKFKEIHKDKWREARKPLLASLDIEYIKAVESADTTKQTEIASQKQALRDVTQIQISGNSTEEIKSVWPEVLGEKQ
jgi:hypothetical protein